MAKVRLADFSRGLVKEDNGKRDPELIMQSALVRIADALESTSESTKLMASNYTKMQVDLEYYKAGFARRGEEIKQLKNSQRALRGVATKARKKVS